MEITIGQRKAITKIQLTKWHKATKTEKSAILDAVCAITDRIAAMPAKRSVER